jgi:hypothetical protein
LFSALLVVGLLGASCAWSQSGAVLNGFVKDPSGAGIQGAPVTLYSHSADRVRVVNADYQGYFEFTNLPRGAYDLKAKDPGFKTKRIENIEIIDTPVKAIIVVLQVGEHSGCAVEAPQLGETLFPGDAVSYEDRIDSTEVVGVVHSFEKDLPLWLLSNAKMELLPLGKSGKPWVTESNEKGEFRVTGLEPGKYELRASHDGFWDLLPIRFWITRENLTKIHIYLFGRKESGCTLWLNSGMDRDY